MQTASLSHASKIHLIASPKLTLSFVSLRHVCLYRVQANCFQCAKLTGCWQIPSHCPQENGQAPLQNAKKYYLNLAKSLKFSHFSLNSISGTFDLNFCAIANLSANTMATNNKIPIATTPLLSTPLLSNDTQHVLNPQETIHCKYTNKPSPQLLSNSQ